MQRISKRMPEKLPVKERHGRDRKTFLEFPAEETHKENINNNESIMRRGSQADSSRVFLTRSMPLLVKIELTAYVYKIVLLDNAIVSTDKKTGFN